MRSDKPIRPVEHLKSDERDLVAKFLEATAQKGVLVGILPGESDDDYRPVLLAPGGALSVVRRLHAKKNQSTVLQDVVLRVLNESCPSKACEAAGRIGGDIWYRRGFAPHTLYSLEGLNKAKALGADRVVATLFEQLLSYHRRSAYHGHISTANIGIFGIEVCWLDLGASAYLNGVSPGSESDFRGFLEVARELGCSMNEQRAKELIADSTKRVSLSDLEAIIPALPKSKSSSQVQTISPGAIRSGKLISAEARASGKRINAADEQTTVKSEPSSPRIGIALSGKVRESLIWLLVVAILLLTVQRGISYFSKVAEVSESQLQSYWASNQPSLMQEVVKAAISNVRSDAASIIIGDALNSVQHPLVQNKFLKLAFDPRWEGELSNDDRLLALTIGTSSIFAADTKALRPLESLHPAMAFSLLATTDISKPFAGFDEVKPSHLTSLPSPIGDGFQLLSNLGVLKISDQQARGLAHIFSADASREALFAFFSASEASESSDVKKVLLLLPLIQEIPKIAEAVVEALLKSGSPLAKILNWFQSTDMTKWSELGYGVELSLITGNFPNKQFQVDALADLLSFPVEVIRKQAATKLLSQLPPESAKVIDFIVSGAHSFTRYQVVTLVSILTLSGDKSQSYISAWFDTKPDPLGVLGILAARKNVRGVDPLNVESARYLKSASWTAPFIVLKSLVDHPEPLLRAIIYSKLDPHRSEDLELLQAMQKVDPSERMREVIRQRLENVTAGVTAN